MEHEVKKEEMAALESLAKTNVEISKAKAALQNLKDLEGAFLDEQDKKAFKRIEKILKDSEGLLKKAKGNYEEVGTLAKNAMSLAAFLSEAHEDFKGIVKKYTEKKRLHEESIEESEAAITEAKKELEKQQKEINEQNKEVEKTLKDIENTKKQLKDERGTLDRAVERLKKGRV